MDNIEIYHHGVKGQRWGFRRYQNKDGSLTPAGERRLKKQRAKNLEKARKAAAEKRERERVAAEEKAKYEAAKTKALRSGSASDVLKFKNDLTPQQRSEVEGRLGWEARMSELSRKEIPAGKKKLDRIFDTVGDMTDYADKAAKAYNTVANIYNAFNKGGSVLPRIDRDVTKGNSEAVKKARKEQEKQQKQRQQEAKKEEKQQERSNKAERKAEKAERKAEKARAKAEKYKVIGKGTSIRREEEPGIIIDLEPSSVPTQTRQLGQRYIAGLLEEPKD